MATVSFSVPDDIKEAFLQAFAHENRSAIIATLMKQAIEEKKRQQRRAVAIDALLELRQRLQPVPQEEITRARQAGRP